MQLRKYIIPRKTASKTESMEETKLLIRIIDNKKIILKYLQEDPFKVLNELIGEPYNEKADEKRAEEWLLRNARSRYRGFIPLKIQ